MLRTIIAGILVAATSANAADIWWEAESPAKTNFPAKTWMSGPNLAKRDQLSGSDWLTADGKRGDDELFATYKITVPEDGVYNLWSRKFWQHGPFTWKFDNEAAVTCGRDVSLADSVELQTHLVANWVYLGKAKLTKGEHTFEIRLLAKAGENTTAAFDCFLLTPGAFMPNGKLKRGERSNLAEAEHFPWEPALDEFRENAMLDLSFLNKPITARVPLSPSDANPEKQAQRFFAVNLSPANAGGSRDSVDYLAAALAKRGVNMIRIHGSLFDFAKGPDAIDAKKLDDIQYMIAAMKKRGIYTTLSVYFPLWVDAEKDLKVADYAGIKNKHPFSLLMFDEEFQKTYRTWVKTILTTKNPYGMTLAEDPALNIFEIQNEDSFFFWTFSKENIPPAKWRDLEKEFQIWCAAKYGSLEKTLEAWGVNKFELLPAWNMTTDGVKATPGGAKRMGDQVRFLAETQRNFYAATKKFLRDELKYTGSVVASNWQTADARTLGAVERWTYTACDVLDRHGYFSGKHEGPTSSYAVSKGDSYEDKSALLNPEAMPFQFHGVTGYPQIMTEIGFTQPNRFRSETTLLSASYAALQGVNGIYYFALSSNFLRDGGVNKFQIADPAIVGTFPAAALLYRQGHVHSATYATIESLDADELFTMRGTATAAAPAFDRLRTELLAKAAVSTFDPLTFFTGPVLTDFRLQPKGIGEGTWPYLPEPAKFIDRQNKIVRSTSTELAWDYGNGLFTINTATAQSVSGFLAKAGKIELPDVTIECKNEYASIVVIALDGKRLKESQKILVQAMTEDKPYGFKSAGGKITEIGGAPFNVRNISAKITLKTLPGHLIVLDENGYALPDKLNRAAANSFELPASAVYSIFVPEQKK